METRRSDMMAEAAEAPNAVRVLLDRQGPAIKAAARMLTEARPSCVTTAARGSSDHVATFFKYLMEMETGIPVASLGPSVASLYEKPLQVAGGVHITVSQSGASPDLLAVQKAAKAGGAATLAIVNVADSPIAVQADLVIALEAGPELSVAATKTFISSATAMAAVVAQASHNQRLTEALHRFPAAMEAASSGIDPGLVEHLGSAQSMFTVGRGPVLALAGEMALKFKELAGLHAEELSLAEIMHGPLSLVGANFPILGIVPDDGALSHHRAALGRLAELGADLSLFARSDLPGRRLPLPDTGQPAIDALGAMLPFYRLAHAVAVAHGCDPEAPRHLKKITLTA